MSKLKDREQVGVTLIIDSTGVAILFLTCSGKQGYRLQVYQFTGVAR